MEKNELIEQVVQKANVSEEEVTKILDVFTGTIKEGLIKGEKVVIAGFGTFSLRRRKGLNFINPKNKQAYEISERVIPHFKAGRNLENSIKKAD